MGIERLGPRRGPREGWDANRVSHWSTLERTCTRCRASIDAGQPYNLDRTGAPHHPECRRIGTYTGDSGPATAPRRPRVQAICPSCWLVIAPGEDHQCLAGDA